MKLMKLKIDWDSNNTKLLIAIIIIWIILAIIFGFTDLEISKALVNRESLWANIGKDYGEAPGYGIIAVAISILIGSYQDELKKQKIAAYVFLMSGAFIIILAIIVGSIWFMAFGGGITLGVLLFLIFTHNRDWREFKKIAIVIILLSIINPLIFVQIGKILCGRVRYNDLSSDYSNYTPWFLPPGPISWLQGNASFPSGHTALAFVSLPLIIEIKENNWNIVLKLSTIFIILSYAFFIAISRVIVGDHYASDVLFSIGVAVVVTILLYKKFY